MLAIYKFVINSLGVMVLYYYVVALHSAYQEKKQILKFVLIIGSICTIFIYLEGYIGLGIRGVCVFLTMLLGLISILKLNIIKAMISCLIYSISLAAGDTFSVLLLSKIYGYSLQQIKTSILLSFTSDLIIYGTSIIILLVMNVILQPKELEGKLSGKTKVSTSVYMMFTVIVIAINYSLHLQFIHLINYKLIIANLIITWVYLILSLYINFIARELSIKEQQYNHQQDYIKTIDGLISDYRRLRHNHANTIYSIYGYIQEKDWDGLQEYFNEVMDETRRISNNTLLALQKIKIYSVFGLLWAKVNQAESLGITFEVEVSNDIKEIKLKLSDLCEVIGNYLDNAIEGTQKSTEKKIGVSIKEDENYISIDILNTYDGEVDINKIYEKGYSTNGDGRGYGLHITETILSKYKNILHNTSFENGIFRQEISIKK